MFIGLGVDWPDERRNDMKFLWIIVQLAFIALKLIPGTEVFNWSWATVFIPTYIYFAFVLVVIFVIAFAAYVKTKF
jgi:uncharacterized membrane protein